MKPQEEVIEHLRKDRIINIEEAQKFIEEKEGGELIEEIYKWKIYFKGENEPFKFKDDEDLIEWCREQRDAYFSEDETEN